MPVVFTSFAYALPDFTCLREEKRENSEDSLTQGETLSRVFVVDVNTNVREASDGESVSIIMVVVLLRTSLIL